MLEVDYPHMESLWPRSQGLFAAELAGMDAAFVDAITWKNGSALYDLPLRALAGSDV
jgi:hypothetical protein